jgi:hypothetical protein
MRYFPSWAVFALILSLSPLFADDTDVQSLQAAAAKGDPAAEQKLGRAYQLGEGVPVDFAKAHDWYRKSAAQGNAKAMHDLGYMYHFGQGVTADQKAAASWFLKAAENDLPAAELAVGTGYRSGTIGLPKDLPAAVKWLTKAAGHTEAADVAAPAANALGTLYESGMDGTGKPDQGKAVFWYKKSADFNYAKAESNLGMYYHVHKEADGKLDIVTCYVWLRLAAAQGEPLAEHMLSEMLDGKEVTDAQIAEADKRANEFRSAHNLPPLPAPRRLVTPATLMLKGVGPKTAQELEAGETNAAPTAGTGTK